MRDPHLAVRRRSRPRTRGRGKKLVGLTAAVAAGVAVSVVPASGAAAAPATPAVTPTAGTIAWAPCPDIDPDLGPLLKGLECASLAVPLDYSHPDGRQLNLALTRARHTAPDDQYQGAVLLNRGQWPGPIGRDMPTRYAKGTTGLPTDVGATYDWIGFDPRGVGASEPKLVCDPTYVYPGQADADLVPRTPAEELAWTLRARAYAKDCGDRYGDVLKFLSTKDSARDLDSIRTALGQSQINYIGYDYGTYLGSVYASMFPQRVRRMVLDSVVRPSGVWYQNNLDQNVAAEKRAKNLFSWIAQYDSVYHLGTTEAAAEASYYKGMAMVREAPIDGKIGPAEYTDIFSIDIYRDWNWLTHVKALSDWVTKQDPTALKALFSVPGYPHLNWQAVYSAVQCTDAPWPHNLLRWHQDYSSQYRAGNTFLTWKQAWHNLPCAFWPVAAQAPQKIGQPNVDMLLVQPENDPVHGTAGAIEVHRLFPNSRLLLEAGGNNQSASLSANNNACLNGYVSAYLRDGTRPAAQPGVDATCAARPAPVPTPPAPTGGG